MSDEECQMTFGESQVADEECQVTLGDSQVTDGECQVTLGESQVADGECQVTLGESQMPDGEFQLPADGFQLPPFKKLAQTIRNHWDKGQITCSPALPAFMLSVPCSYPTAPPAHFPAQPRSSSNGLLGILRSHPKDSSVSTSPPYYANTARRRRPNATAASAMPIPTVVGSGTGFTSVNMPSKRNVAAVPPMVVPRMRARKSVLEE